MQPNNNKHKYTSAQLAATSLIIDRLHLPLAHFQSRALLFRDVAACHLDTGFTVPCHTHTMQSGVSNICSHMPMPVASSVRPGTQSKTSAQQGFLKIRLEHFSASQRPAYRIVAPAVDDQRRQIHATQPQQGRVLSTAHRTSCSFMDKGNFRRRQPVFARNKLIISLSCVGIWVTAQRCTKLHAAFAAEAQPRRF